MSVENLSSLDSLRTPSRLIRGSGPMADLVRRHDWSASSLGPIESWPESFLASVNLMLACAFPALIFWGESMVQLYNDAFRPLLAERHPAGLGQKAEEFWSAAWHLIGPRLHRVWSHGETIHDERALVPILREGRIQDVWWNYSYSPIFASDGAVLGILVICQDVTGEAAAVQKLRASEARASRVLQSIGDAVIVTDADSRVLRMNPVAERLTGWTQQEASGKPLPEVFHIVNETTRAPVEDPVNKVRTRGAVVGLANHTTLLARDGREFAIDDSGAPILDDEGRLTGLVLVFRDIGDKRAAERERERLAARLGQLLAVTSDAIVAIDRNWVITYLNPRALELYSAGRTVVGRNVWEIYPDAVYQGSPWIEHCSRAMNEGIPGAFEEYYPEPLNAWLRIEVYPTSDGIVTFSRDITRERADREALRQRTEEAERQRAEIETVYRTAPIGLALFDTKDFRYLRLNDRQAEFFGLRPEQIVGRTLTEMAPIEGLRELFEQVLRGKPVINFPLEGHLVTHPTEHRYWTVSYFPVFAADGSVQAITAASLEVTQQKKTETALLQSEKLAVVGRLAASIAHEINNPLESVTNLLYLAQSTSDPAEIRGYIRTADRELRRVSVISNQTLRFYKQATSPQEITCDELIKSVVSMYQGRILNSGIRIEPRRRAATMVRCFEGEIRQVLTNLVSNAIDAMKPAGGRLCLRTRTATDWKTGQKGVVFTVADTGTGMSPATLSRIFEPFYTTKDIGGTGLGLWISREIVQRHGGRLGVRSTQTAGRSGTVFTVYLPLEPVAR
jgi:PAS domain S-box-containing protein